MVDDQQPRAEPLDVGQVVRRQQHRHAALAVDLRRGTPAPPPSRPRRGRSSARRGRGSSGSCSSAAVSSPRIRWPSESWRTGVARNSAEVEHLARSGRGSRGAAARGRGRCGAAARTSRRAAGPTRAASAGRTRPRCGARARSAAASGSRPATRSRPALGHEDAGQHLDRRRLAGAVRADVADDRAALDRERDPVDGAARRAARGAAGPPSPARRSASRPSSSSMTGSATGAPVVPHGIPPDARRRRATASTATSGDRYCKPSGSPSVVVLVEDVERGEVGDEGDRDEEDDEAAQPAREDPDRVLRRGSCRRR